VAQSEASVTDISFCNFANSVTAEAALVPQPQRKKNNTGEEK